MLALTTKHQLLICCSVACLFHFGSLRCEAQNNEGSLFVIKAPAVGETTSYVTPPEPPKVASLKAAFIKSPQAKQEAPDLEISSRENQRVEFNAPAADEEPDALLEEIKRLDQEMNEDRESKQDDDSNAELDQLIKDSGIDRDDEDKESAEEKRPEPSMTTWNLKPMSAITANIRPVSGESPEDQSWQLTSQTSMPLAASKKLYAWAAPNIKYNPLYFEDVALERYGQTKGVFVQPIASGVHFVRSAALLPYHSIYDPVNSCDGPLGYCRPGTQVGCQKERHYFGNPFQLR